MDTIAARRNPFPFYLLFNRRVVSYIEQIAPAEADGLLNQIYTAATKRAGGVANIIQLMSLDAESCQASMAFYIKLMKTGDVLSRADREMLATVVSCVNDCYY